MCLVSHRQGGCGPACSQALLWRCRHHMLLVLLSFYSAVPSPMRGVVWLHALAETASWGVALAHSRLWLRTVCALRSITCHELCSKALKVGSQASATELLLDEFPTDVFSLLCAWQDRLQAWQQLRCQLRDLWLCVCLGVGLFNACIGLHARHQVGRCGLLIMEPQLASLSAGRPADCGQARRCLQTHTDAGVYRLQRC